MATGSHKNNSRSTPKLTIELCAVKLVTMNVLNSSQFAVLKAKKARPPEIPSNPDSFYADFPGWKNFIQMGIDGAQSGLSVVPIPSYQKLKHKVRRLGISTKREFVIARRNNKLCDGTPRHPDLYYENEWEGWDDFLTPSLKYLPFKEARQIIRNIGLRTSSDWFEFCKTGKRPSYVPAMPHRDYDEFTTWNNFLCKPNCSERKENS